MIMVTGGAYQGKTDFVKSYYGCEITDGEKCNFNNVFTNQCVNNFQMLIKRLIDDNQDVISFTEKLCNDNPNIIVIMNEIGCGIIPLEKKDRIWREQVGRAGCIIAEKSETVIRLMCGIPLIIKGGLK